VSSGSVAQAVVQGGDLALAPAEFPGSWDRGAVSRPGAATPGTGSPAPRSSAEAALPWNSAQEVRGVVLVRGSLRSPHESACAYFSVREPDPARVATPGSRGAGASPPAEGHFHAGECGVLRFWARTLEDEGSRKQEAGRTKKAEYSPLFPHSCGALPVRALAGLRFLGESTVDS
jgi:hypothetical protein